MPFRGSDWGSGDQRLYPLLLKTLEFSRGIRSDALTADGGFRTFENAKGIKIYGTQRRQMYSSYARGR